eukprot:COSAG01_NODE_973_length_12368_cov_12.435732_12_plen_118_part_00
MIDYHPWPTGPTSSIGARSHWLPTVLTLLICACTHARTHTHTVVAVGRDSKRWRLSRHARVAQAHDPTVAAINRRAAAVLRLPLANQEPLDVLRSETSASAARRRRCAPAPPWSAGR